MVLIIIKFEDFPDDFALKYAVEYAEFLEFIQVKLFEREAILYSRLMRVFG